MNKATLFEEIKQNSFIELVYLPDDDTFIVRQNNVLNIKSKLLQIDIW